MGKPKCPECGATMRLLGRGATLRKHGPRWVCPVAEAETLKDERGHLYQAPDAKHKAERVWHEWELARLEGKEATDATA